MDFEIQFKQSALKNLRKIATKDRERVLAKIITLKEDPRPPGSLKLTNQEAYRIRQGDYRIIYTVEDNILLIEVIRIGHRRDVYG